MKRYISILLLLVSISLTVRGQGSVAGLTTIVGEVTDAGTGEPIEGVSVYFRGTSYGTSTTKEGVFLLRAPLVKKATMVVSAVGYKPQQFKVEAGRQAGIDVQLTEEPVGLAEVFVVPGSNPALALMDSVRAYGERWRSGLRNEGETAVQVYLSDIRAKHLRRRLWKRMEGAMVRTVSTTDTTYLLPLYNSAEAGQTASDGVWKVFLSDAEQRADFYHSTVSYCGTAFLSPVAASGTRYYTYLLTDSTYETQGDGTQRKTYAVAFRTKNPYYATFNGRLLIDSATYALRAVEAEVPQETNVNYLRHLHISQDYGWNAEGYALRSERVSELLDVAVKRDTSHTFPTLLMEWQYCMPEEQAGQRPQQGLTVKRAEVRPVRGDSMPTPPLLRVGEWLAQIVVTGYIPTGTAVDFGKVPDILRVNRQEKVRLGLPLRTNARMSDRVCLEGYAAYGFGDREWKGKGAVRYQLPTERRHILSLGYKDDYAVPDADYFTAMKMENNAWYQDRSLTSHWTEPFYRGTTYLPKAIRRREIRLNSENDWRDGVESYAQLAFGWEADYRYSQVGATVRLSWQERKADLYFQRVHVYNHLPVVYLNGEIGSVHYAGRTGYDMYGKLRLMVRQRVDLGMGGRLDYLAEAGCLLGNVPETMGFVFAGNDSYAFDPYSFTLMHRGQFKARRYVSLQAEWNGKGCLFNRIPWVQRLRLRELAVAKVAYGGDLKVPYTELGIGIGNILRVADLYAVFRVTRLNDTSSPWWGVRFRLRVEG
ncbi:MAG: carboxypeptidase-like regulatory domain-containing protein [Paludibacteraceae bacterium]|nr:carboxypeptidase-like regulatory domain-containing protein [Paludibacteraceae bacterium]